MLTVQRRLSVLSCAPQWATFCEATFVPRAIVAPIRRCNPINNHPGSLIIDNLLVDEIGAVSLLKLHLLLLYCLYIVF